MANFDPRKNSSRLRPERKQPQDGIKVEININPILDFQRSV
jgi:hypothetical protein